MPRHNNHLIFVLGVSIALSLILLYPCIREVWRHALITRLSASLMPVMEIDPFSWLSLFTFA